MLVSKEVLTGERGLVGFGLLAGLLAWLGEREKRRTRGGGDEMGSDTYRKRSILRYASLYS